MSKCETAPVAERLAVRAGRRQFLKALMLGSTLACYAAPTDAAEPATKANTSRSARDEAARLIPVDKLDPALRGKVMQVVNDPSLFRRMPITTIDCDPDLYLFLVRHPEVVVNIWDAMGVTKMVLAPTGPNSYRCTDGEGTTGEVAFAYRSEELHVLFSEGSYEGPMLPRKVRGQCVMILATNYTQETNGRYYVTSRLDSFLRLDNVGAELIAKTLQPIMGKAADFNFVETTNFLGNLSRTSELNPAGIERFSEKLVRLQPEVRREFVTVTATVAARNSVQPASNVVPIAERDRSSPIRR